MENDNNVLYALWVGFSIKCNLYNAVGIKFEKTIGNE